MTLIAGLGSSSVMYALEDDLRFLVLKPVAVSPDWVDILTVEADANLATPDREWLRITPQLVALRHKPFIRPHPSSSGQQASQIMAVTNWSSKNLQEPRPSRQHNIALVDRQS